MNTMFEKKSKVLEETCSLMDKDLANGGVKD